MSLSDPIADMLTRIRNAVKNRVEKVDCRNSKICQGIAEVLKQEGYIDDYLVLDDNLQGVLRVQLRYGPEGQPLIRKLDRLSRPGRRRYAKVNELPRPLDGLGVAIVSSSSGILSDREARKRGVGGELLCLVE